MKIDIKTNFPEISRRVATLRDDIASRALASAMNKTIEQARTQMTREITAEYNVTAAYARHVFPPALTQPLPQLRDEPAMLSLPGRVLTPCSDGLTHGLLGSCIRGDGMPHAQRLGFGCLPGVLGEDFLKTRRDPLGG